MTVTEIKEKRKLLCKAISLLISLTSQPQAFWFFNITIEERVLQESLQEYEDTKEIAFYEDQTIENLENYALLLEHYPQIMASLMSSILK